MRNYGKRDPNELFDVYCFARELDGETDTHARMVVRTHTHVHRHTHTETSHFHS